MKSSSSPMKPVFWVTLGISAFEFVFGTLMLQKPHNHGMGNLIAWCYGMDILIVLITLVAMIVFEGDKQSRTHQLNLKEHQLLFESEKTRQKEIDAASKTKKRDRTDISG